MGKLWKSTDFFSRSKPPLHEGQLSKPSIHVKGGKIIASRLSYSSCRRIWRPLVKWWSWHDKADTDWSCFRRCFCVNPLYNWRIERRRSMFLRYTLKVRYLQSHWMHKMQLSNDNSVHSMSTIGVFYDLLCPHCDKMLLDTYLTLSCYRTSCNFIPVFRNNLTDTVVSRYIFVPQE